MLAHGWDGDPRCGIGGAYSRLLHRPARPNMKHQPQIQITEEFSQVMPAPAVEVVAWWSLENVDRYRFLEADPARKELTFEDGIRQYETTYGTVTERLNNPDIPPAVTSELAAEGYSVSHC